MNSKNKGTFAGKSMVFTPIGESIFANLLKYFRHFDEFELRSLIKSGRYVFCAEVCVKRGTAGKINAGTNGGKTGKISKSFCPQKAYFGCFRRVEV